MVLLYSEISILCMTILGLILFRIIKNKENNKGFFVFKQIMFISILFFLADMCWGYATLGVIEKTKNTLIVLNVVYYCFACCLSCIWMYYSETFIVPKWLNFSWKNIVFIIPLFSEIILMTISSFTGISFYVDDNMEYTRGPLYLLQIVIAYYPLLVASIRALYYSMKKENYANKSMLITMGSFPLFPLIFGAVQFWFVDYPILTFGITLGTLTVYLHSLDAQISIDVLTQINNRNQLLKNLSHEMNDDKYRDSLYLFMLDADYFKDINDRYGHAEGDNALIRIADVLKEVAGMYNSSIYRFGGDEFIMISHVRSDAKAEQIRETILDTMKENNKLIKSPYELKVSVGYARYTEDIKTIPDFIKAADSELYKVKKSRPPKVR